jgi:Ser/Thr protein kinase RdoA (MazF antagonist)
LSDQQILAFIVSQFSIPGRFLKAARFGSGLINDTYLCEFMENDVIRKYITQRINPSVFKNPENVMENVEKVTSHIENRLRKQGIADPRVVTPSLLPTRNGQPFYRDDSGAYWRTYYFIESGTVYDAVRDEQHAYEVGRGLGKFQSLVADMEPKNLRIILPEFHHTAYYLTEYDDALRADVKSRASTLQKETLFVSHRRHLAPLLTDLMISGQIPVRVVHNDPKVNNIMIHTLTREALCMLDLDTVMPGIVHFDFGDCVRSAANPAGETTQDLEQVSIDMPLFEAVASGYLHEAGTFLTQREIETLHYSVKIITFELGIRFLADYLRGDVYFKIKYPSHNLDRSRVQFKLLESIEAADRQIIVLIARLASPART